MLYLTIEATWLSALKAPVLKFFRKIINKNVKNEKFADFLICLTKAILFPVAFFKSFIKEKYYQIKYYFFNE